MKTILTLFIVALCGAFAATSALGQTTNIWTGAGDGTNVALAANWSPANPSPITLDWGEFNGSVPGDLNLVYNLANWPGSYNTGGGVTIWLTSGQTSPVSISTTVSGVSGAYAFAGFSIDSGAGAFTMGGPNSGSKINFIGRPSGAVHIFRNDSANTATITPWIKWTAGGGATWTADFTGAGNWQVNSYMNNDNNAGANIIQVDGPGTVFWDPQGFLGSDGIGNPVINGGMLVLQAPHPKILNQAWTLNGILNFDAPSQSQTLAGVISGGGSLWVSGGTLTLSGASTYVGGTVLTNTGTLILAGAENTGTFTGPMGTGPIAFFGGTLQWSSANTFDYSSRFDPSDDNQQIKLNTGGQAVTLANDMGFYGSTNITLTKSGVGTLTLTGGADYSGLTTVTGGKLVFDSQKNGSGNITISDGAALGAYSDYPITPGTLTLGTSAGCTVEFNNVNSTTTAPITANTIASAGTTTINVNSGSFTTIGTSYPLLSWTTGPAPAVELGVLNGAVGNLTTNGNTIQLNITDLTFRWTGLNNNNWDLTTSGNWQRGGSPVVYSDTHPAVFDDSAFGTTEVNINALLEPISVTVNDGGSVNGGKDYTINSFSGMDISGTNGLTKSGLGSLTLLGGFNTYTGPTTVLGGLLTVSNLANGGAASDIGASGNDATNLVLDGGTLQYIGAAASSDRSFTLGAAGGTLDASGSGALNLNNPGLINVTGSGPHGLTLTGSDTNGEALAASIPDGSGGTVSLTKNGGNTWTLTGTNTYSGGSTINQGTLQIGAGGTSGTVGNGNVIANGVLRFNRTDSLTVPGAISGLGRVVQAGSGTVILAGNNNYSGGTSISNGATLQIGTGVAGAALNANAPIVDNGLFIFNSKTPLIISGFANNVSGTGNLIVKSGCSFGSVAANTYSGWTLIEPGAQFEPTSGNSGSLNSSVVTNNGTLYFERQDNGVFVYSNNIVGSGKVLKDNNNQNAGDVTLSGANNTYTGGTWIAGGGIILGGYSYSVIVTNITATTTNYTTNTFDVDGGNIVGPVIFTNTASAWLNPRQLTFSYFADHLFTNDIIGAVTDGSLPGARGNVIKANTNTVILTGNNTYVDGTTINAGVLQIGNGGTTGTAGTGGISIPNSASSLIFDRSDNVTFNNNLTGTGSVVQDGTGILTLTGLGNTNFTGLTIVSNGTLAASSIVGNVELDGGSLSPAAPGTVAEMGVGGSLVINSGSITITLNKSLTPQNSVINVTNAVIQNNGGSTTILKLVNAGPALQVGDTFYPFNGTVVGSGDTMQIVCPGYTFQNNLFYDGSVTVTGVVAGPGTFTNPTGITSFQLNGSNVVLTGTNGESGAAYYLLESTNVALPLSQWLPVATNVLSANGNYTFTGTNVVAPDGVQQFYILSNTNNY